MPPHSIEQLFFYAVSPEAEPRDVTPLLIDVSAPESSRHGPPAMQGARLAGRSAELHRAAAHARAARSELRAGVSHAIALFPNDPLAARFAGALSP